MIGIDVFKSKKYSIIICSIILVFLILLHQILITLNSIQQSEELIKNASYKQFLNENRTSENKGVSILLTGDSIAYGVGSSRYNYTLHNQLFMYFNETYSNYSISVENRARAGNKISDLVKRDENIITTRNYNISVIIIGSNDVFYFTPLNSFEKDLRTLIQQRLSVSEEIVLVGPGRVHETSGLSILLGLIYEQTSKQYSNIYKDVSDEFENVVYINPLNNNLTNSTYSNTLAKDGIHPNDRGYEYWKNLVVLGVERTQFYENTNN